jgi:protoheme ferro-lyase
MIPHSNQPHILTLSIEKQSDGDIIPFGRFQKLFANIITKLRTSKIQKQYAEIGGGSPIRKWSELQAQETCRILDTTSPSSAPHLPYLAFRYAHPLTEDVYSKLLEDGFGKRGRVIAFSQYPQYSCGTTGSSINELFRCREKLERPGSRMKWSIIDRWPAHPKFVEAVARNIEAGLAGYPSGKRIDVTIIFSAHSQPMSAVNQGVLSSESLSPARTEADKTVSHRRCILVRGICYSVCSNATSQLLQPIPSLLAIKSRTSTLVRTTNQRSGREVHQKGRYGLTSCSYCFYI